VRLILMLNKRIEERAAPEPDTDVACNHLHMYPKLDTDAAERGNICVLCGGIAPCRLPVMNFPRAC